MLYYISIILKKTAGSIIIKGSSSPIEISDMKQLPAGNRIDLKTTYKPITLTLIKDAPVAIHAKTKHGKIRSEYPVYLNDDEKSVRIEEGEQNIPVRIETSHNITIKKE